MDRKIDASVVIGFKDWGLERLILSIGTIRASFGRFTGEVIVSDYGSLNGFDVQRAVEGAGATYVRTETDGTWSRSRAINAGFAHAEGEVLISTDADMVFSPEAIEIVVGRVLDAPSDSLVLQCRDLPSTYSHEAIDAEFLDWDEFELVAKLRPRWGMGGMFAASRKTVFGVRGYDSRMHTYGGEDLDFATRVRRSGSPLTWIDEPGVRMYHVWHPSTRSAQDKTTAGTEAINRNREIYHNDKTVVRNVEFGDFSMLRANPLCSIIMSVTVYSEYLVDSLWSALNQSFRDFELIVVNSSGDKRVRELLSSVNDSRLKVREAASLGSFASLNEAVRVARGRYTLIHDQMSFMAPTRIVEQFRALNQGFAGTYGGIIRVDSRTGELKAVDNAWFGRSPANELADAETELSLMVITDVLRKIPFDEDCDETAGSRFIYRLANSGIALNHTGWYHCAHLDFDAERSEEYLEERQARRNLVAARRQLVLPGSTSDKELKPPALRPKKDLEAFALPMLPPRFVRRYGWVTLPSTVSASSLLDELDGSGYAMRIESGDGTVHSNRFWLQSVTAKDLAVLRNAEAQLDLAAIRCHDDYVDTFSQGNLLQEAIVREVSALKREFFGSDSAAKWLVVSSPDMPAPSDDVLAQVASQSMSTVHRVIYSGDAKEHVFAIGARDLLELLPLLSQSALFGRGSVLGIFSEGFEDRQLNEFFNRPAKARVEA